MTNTYKASDKTQLTAHFNVSEFKCKCGQNHDTIINPELPKKLEQLHEKLNCSKIIINSGYRCTSHDKAVGGSGAGHHVYGNAADIVCYDQSNNKISSKKVSCAAQDIGTSDLVVSQISTVHILQLMSMCVHLTSGKAMKL